ncbi:MAG TPA: DUF368 domain-containing protein [Methanoregulaceae archaeon]|nr:DUF368 domain-containing protein [Methanoregulaceae archaeon]HPD10336.1 DUF368 domain-containing protein [Methanoregulaceae archaeon]HRT15434.1 DUF368 domain-containing protein [Methanoregulaceae archaeon]HRU30907.1 DUF368 domain-containing protein [Methanoregulaceae archaeon]
MLFITGFIALCAMILPGISGAYITHLMNQYTYLLAAIATLDLAPLIVYIAGGAAGLLTMSRILKALLRTYHTQALAFLTGLMLGSMRMVVDQIVSAGGTVSTLWIPGAAGVLIIVFLELTLRRFPVVT